jgi:hypothetical protein
MAVLASRRYPGTPGLWRLDFPVPAADPDRSVEASPGLNEVLGVGGQPVPAVVVRDREHYPEHRKPDEQVRLGTRSEHGIGRPPRQVGGILRPIAHSRQNESRLRV